MNLPLISYILAFIILITLSCKEKSNHIINSVSNIQPDYLTVFEHDAGDLCYYPKAANKKPFVAIEREEIVSPPGYVAHIWLYDMGKKTIRQMTTNPEEGKYDDRNLRFNQDDTYIYFIRTHWHADGSNDKFLCRIPIDGDEQDVEYIPINEMTIYCFDFLPDDSKLLIAYYNSSTKEHNTGFLNLSSNHITTLNHLYGHRHNCMVPLPDSSGFIASTGIPSSSLFSYEIKRHYFNGQTSEIFQNPPLTHIVWTLAINPAGDKLLVHQGVCTKSKTHYIPINDGTSTPILTEYTLPRDASWGTDSYIYFTSDGNVMRYGIIN